MRCMGRPTDKDRREAVKILAERHDITRVDEVYEDGETLLSRAAGRAGAFRLGHRFPP